MADSETQENTAEGNNGSARPQPQTSSGPGIIGYISQNKIDAALWMTRIFTVICSIGFLFPFFSSNPVGLYQKALISNAATSALRMHQRLPQFQLSRDFLARMLAEDSCHYLFFSLIFLNSFPVTLVLIPLFLFAVLHSASFTIKLLNQIGPNSLPPVRNLMAKLQLNQQAVLRFIAITEILLMPGIVFMLIGGKTSILMPFVYYRFLTLRYSSRRNPYSRQIFGELRIKAEQVVMNPNCPGIVRNLLRKSIDVISKLAPQIEPQQQ
ncbi:transmembrane protein 33-like [Tubulanus polymorphus]|uniref:transmembrane protein 33-like n=1 Tax=Tubulanus polymorphus TaxID=672921 RepID=UPI003DA50538